MLTLSYTAQEHFARLLADAEAPDDAVIRLVSENNGIGLAIGTVESGDVTFAHADKAVLAIDEQVSELLANKKIDVRVTDDHSELVLIEQLEEDELDD